MLANSMASLQFEWQWQLGFKYISFVVKSTMKIGFLYFLHNNTSVASVSSSIVHIGLCCCLRSNVRFVLAVASVVWTSTRLAVSQYTRWVIDFSIIKRPSTERELSSYEAMLCYEKKEWIRLVYYCNRITWYGVDAYGNRKGEILLWLLSTLSFLLVYQFFLSSYHEKM